MTTMTFAAELKNLFGDDAEVVTTHKGTGLRIHNIYDNIEPIVYTDDYCFRGISPEDAYNEIVTMIQFHEEPKVNYDISDFAQAKSHIRPVLVREDQVPKDTVLMDCVEFPDLYVAFQLTDVIENGIAHVSNSLLENWKINLKALNVIASLNVKEDCVMLPLNNVMAELMNCEPDDLPDNPAWIVTNKKKWMGAYSAVILKDEICKEFPEGCYVIPSSRHEMLVIPKSGNCDPDFLNNMITEINHNEVAPNDVLSNHYYEF